MTIIATYGAGLGDDQGGRAAQGRQGRRRRVLPHRPRRRDEGDRRDGIVTEAQRSRNGSVTEAERTAQASAAYSYRKTPLFNVLLKKFKNTTGGRLKACLSGGGAISAEVQEWVRTALDAPLVQGYGLTETCAGATIQMWDDMSIGIAGTQ